MTTSRKQAIAMMCSTVLAVTSSPVAAQQANSMLTVTDVQRKRVFEVAQVECPALFQTDDPSKKMRQVVTDRKLSLAELSLLVDFCSIYGAGREFTPARK